MGPNRIFVDGADVYSIGRFYCYNGNSAYDIVKTNNFGLYDGTFNTTIGTSGSTLPTPSPGIGGTERDPMIYGICKESTSGKIIIGGLFNKWDNSFIPTNLTGSGCPVGSGSYSSVIRLNSNGSLDTTFNAWQVGYKTNCWNNNYIPTTVLPFANGWIGVGYITGGGYILDATGSLVTEISNTAGNGIATFFRYGSDTVGSPGKFLIYISMEALMRIE